MPTTLRVPTIHLNGDTRETLMQQVCDAYLSLGDALEAFGQMAPNGRNYYPQGPDAMLAAANAHRALAQRLADIRDEVESYGLAIQDA